MAVCTRKREPKIDWYKSTGLRMVCGTQNPNKKKNETFDVTISLN
jgi:hypothetical protein